MRRIKPLSFVVLCGICCVAVAVLWARSYFVEDGYVARTMWPSEAQADAHHRHRSIISCGGCVTFTALDITTRDDPARRPDRVTSMRTWFHRPNRGSERLLEPAMPRPGTFWNRLGFDVERGWMVYAGRGTTQSLSITFPWWAVILATAFPPAYVARRRHARRERRRAGRCADCGYDLRASPERCPECGVLPSGA
jgi:hypothetical protein